MCQAAGPPPPPPTCPVMRLPVVRRLPHSDVRQRLRVSGLQGSCARSEIDARCRREGGQAGQTRGKIPHRKKSMLWTQEGAASRLVEQVSGCMIPELRCRQQSSHIILPSPCVKEGSLPQLLRHQVKCSTLPQGCRVLIKPLGLSLHRQSQQRSDARFTDGPRPASGRGGLEVPRAVLLDRVRMKSQQSSRSTRASGVPGTMLGVRLRGALRCQCDAPTVGSAV